MFEPIVSRDTIRDRARQAAEAGQHHIQANPYPEFSAAHIAFEHDWHAAVLELEAQESLV
jgi:hypothetical protein